MAQPRDPNNNLRSIIPSPTTYPGKAFVTVYTIIIKILLYTPLLAAYYSRRSNRPNPRWTFHNALSNKLTKIVIDLVAAIEWKIPPSLEPGPDGRNFQLMEPSPESPEIQSSHDVPGSFLNNNTEIKPVPIGGIWVPSQYSTATNSGRKLILHFHGGAYVTLSPRLASTRWGPQMLSSELGGVKVLMPSYRLASNPHGRFPAQLQDAITAYRFVLHSLQVPAADVVLSGDSAGGNLVLALLRYIADNRTTNTATTSADIHLPSPSAALLWSPWSDLSSAQTIAAMPQHRNYGSDFLTPSFLSWGTRSFLPPTAEASDPYFSPGLHPFHTPTRLFVNAGTAEVLVDEVRELAEGFAGVRGNTVTQYEIEDGPHDCFAVGGDMGFVEQVRGAIRAAGDFLGVEVKGKIKRV
ncbi:MAG: hypothetical protein M1831_001107 [Alyxoria varia]|nr:MAG: hypothetical protein M1831_001107 [Alyxoria varia]